MLFDIKIKYINAVLQTFIFFFQNRWPPISISVEVYARRDCGGIP